MPLMPRLSAPAGPPAGPGAAPAMAWSGRVTSVSGGLASAVVDAYGGQYDYGPAEVVGGAVLVGDEVVVLFVGDRSPVLLALGGATVPWMVARLISAASTNATSVKAAAGKVGGWYLYNAAGALRYLKLYDTASSPSVGTDVPKMTVPVPAGAAANVEFGNGIDFDLGIGLALTTGLADSDTSAVGANDLVINLLWS